MDRHFESSDHRANVMNPNLDVLKDTVLVYIKLKGHSNDRIIKSVQFFIQLARWSNSGFLKFRHNPINSDKHRRSL